MNGVNIFQYAAGYKMPISSLTIPSLLRVLRFYRWAFGDLMASDSDVGTIGEYLVGSTLDCLPPARKVQAPFDLVTKTGVAIEVKTTSRLAKRRNKILRVWDISDQRTALEGKRQLADLWVFLVAQFPERATTREQLAVFEPKYWTAYLATGEQVRASGCRCEVSETTLARLGIEPIPFAQFSTAFAKLNLKIPRLTQP